MEARCHQPALRRGQQHSHAVADGHCNPAVRVGGRAGRPRTGRTRFEDAMVAKFSSSPKTPHPLPTPLRSSTLAAFSEQIFVFVKNNFQP